MAVKDFDTSENKDLEKASDEGKAQQDTIKHFPKESKGIGEVDVKNAHATGDGSFGRNDGSLPEEDTEDKKRDTNY